MQTLSNHEVHQVSGGGVIKTLGIILTLPITVPLSLIAGVIASPIVFGGAAVKLGSNIADYYSGWDQVTGWNEPKVTHFNQE